MTEVTPRDRDRIAECAASFTTDADDIQAVLANARPLLTWAELAADDEDLDKRISIMEGRADRNYRRKTVTVPCEVFLKDVRDAYEFLTGKSS